MPLTFINAHIFRLLVMALNEIMFAFQRVQLGKIIKRTGWKFSFGFETVKYFSDRT